ncbi:MAG TPA: arginine--tRNA ligase [Gemmatimonadales bacterium]|nr:arginine--tRNA ligase [Gemmatimonadales bacterium]
MLTQAGADRLRDALHRAAADLGSPDAEVTLERPRDPGHGDLATNLAMKLAGPRRQKPRDVAQAILDRLALPPSVVTRAEIAGPGFINFWLAAQTLTAVLEAIVSAGSSYGRGNAGHGRPVNVEFVSANPTGPLHVGHGRQAALGDSVARLLEFSGWRVTREFYYNDAGAQITNLGRSVQARIQQALGREATIPEGGYHGEYVRDLARRYLTTHPGDPEGADAQAVQRFAVQELRAEQDRDLRALGIGFDVYYLESSLYDQGKVEDAVRRLSAAGHTYQSDGALWLRTTTFGDDKDRVMRKSAEKGGDFTYFLPDVAYHLTKWERGFTRAINVQGADHHSTVTRVRIGLQALGMGIPQGYPEYVLHQMVTVMRGGEEVKISKRAGSYVTVRDLVDEVGADAVRYFYLMRRADSHFVFDLDLAAKQTEENPVYYVQYAHTRMAGIFRAAGVSPHQVRSEGVDLAVLDQPDEQDLMKHLGEFPAVAALAAEQLEPHRLVAYLDTLARLINGWYHRHRVLGAEPGLERARLVLVRAAQVVLANGLGLLGVSAPERM